MKRDMNAKDRKLAEKERELWSKNQELQEKVQEVDDYKSRPDNPDGGGGGETYKATGNINIKRRLNDEIGVGIHVHVFSNTWLSYTMFMCTYMYIVID